MPPCNPTGDEELDFNDEGWEGVRAAIIGGGKTNKEATEMLRQSWRVKHNRDMARWAEYLHQEQGADQAPRGAEPEVEVVPEVETPKDPESPDQFSLPTPNFLDIRPARHVLKRLEKKEFMELWHFTAEGCREAVAIDLATPNDIFGLVDTGNGLILQTIGATTTSTKAVSVRKLDLSHLCFSLNFLFSYVPHNFLLCFPLLTYSQSFPFLIC